MDTVTSLSLEAKVALMLAFLSGIAIISFICSKFFKAHPNLANDPALEEGYGYERFIKDLSKLKDKTFIQNLLDSPIGLKKLTKDDLNKLVSYIYVNQLIIGDNKRLRNLLMAIRQQILKLEELNSTTSYSVLREENINVLKFSVKLLGRCCGKKKVNALYAGVCRSCKKK